MEKIPKLRKAAKGASKISLVLGIVAACSLTLWYPMTYGAMQLKEKRHYTPSEAWVKEYSAGLTEIDLTVTPFDAKMKIEKMFGNKIELTAESPQGPITKVQIRDILNMGGLYCKGDECSKEVIEKANELWKEYWDIAEGDEVLKEWEAWKKNGMDKELSDRL